MATPVLVPWSWVAFLAAAGGAHPPSVLHVELHGGSCDNAKDSLPFEAAIARTEAEREKGLGVRTNALAKNEGMIFVYDVPGPKTFWMKDTHIPLAIFYYNAEGKLLSSSEMPIERDPANPSVLYPENGAVSAVLEVESGITQTVKARKLDVLCIPSGKK